MTDTRARDALAAALHKHSDICAVFDHVGRYEDEWLCNATALAILSDPDQRRALTAAFLDAEALAEALQAAMTDTKRSVDYSPLAAAVLAALRETP